MIAFLIIMVAVAIFIIIRVMATRDSGLGRFFRWYWNTSFKLISFIPFCGWMTCFMVATSESEQAMKEYYINIGNKSDALGYDIANTVAERARQKREQEELIRNKLATKGISCTSVSDDGSYATGTDRYGNPYRITINWDK